MNERDYQLVGFIREKMDRLDSLINKVPEYSYHASMFADYQFLLYTALNMGLRPDYYKREDSKYNRLGIDVDFIRIHNYILRMHIHRNEIIASIFSANSPKPIKTGIKINGVLEIFREYEYKVRGYNREYRR